MFKVSVIGATGYVGAEITRILSEHPGFKIDKLTSRTFAGEKFSDVYPSLKNKVDIILEDTNIDKIAESSDFVVTALPHGVSSKMVPQLLERGIRVLDHSGDYRFRNIKDYEEAYKLKHNSEKINDEAVYGLPEIYRDKIKDSYLVSNPGCYPTCSILGMMPLLKNKAINPKGIIINAVSGVSGAGRKSKLAFSYCETNENYKSYSPINHRHTWEIEQEFSYLYDKKINLTFTPHLAPMKRGMMCTIYSDLKKGLNIEYIKDLYKNEYENEYFVRFLGRGVMPETKMVSGSNYIDVSYEYNEKTGKLIVFSSLDNLGKGAASQGIQCMNIMAGYNETDGLKRVALYI